MKNKKILILTLLAGFLSSCSSSNSDYTSLPNKGTSLNKTQGLTKLNASLDTIKNIGSDTAIGISLDNGYSKNKVSGSVIEEKTSANIASLDANINLENLNVNFGLDGLFSNTLDDFKASFNLGLDLGGSIKYINNLDDTQNIDKTFNEANYSLKADLLSDGLYIYINDNLYNLLNDLLSIYFSSSDIDFSLSEIFSKKTHIPYDLTYFFNAPILDKETLTNLIDSLEGSLSSINFGEFKDHGNETYSYSHNFDSAELSSLVRASGDSYTFSFKEGSYIKFALIFKDESIVSFGLESSVEVNLDYIYSYYDENTNMTYDLKIDGSIKNESGFKIEFLTGENVKFNDVDKSSFTNFDALIS